LLSCPDDQVTACTAQPTVCQAKYLFLKTLTNRVEGFFLSEKKIERVMEKFAVRNNLVLVCLNLGFINLSSGVAIFFW